MVWGKWIILANINKWDSHDIQSGYKRTSGAAQSINEYGFVIVALRIPLVGFRKV